MNTNSRYRSLLPVFWMLLALLAACTPAATLTPTPRIVQPTATTQRFEPSATPAAATVTTTPTRAPTATTAPTPTEEAVAVITPPSLVRRLAAGVFAGQALPLSEISGSDGLNLEPGGLVQTDLTGEAEVLIEGCLSLFVFQDAKLTRSTCRREDAQSGLGFCAAGGLVTVVNNCTTQVDIQTPSANISSSGTQFSVLYIPEQQLSIVQLYEGGLDVQAVIDPSTGQMGASSQMEENTMWFSQPGDAQPFINGVSGRVPVPLEAWEAIKGDVLRMNPNVSKWMSSVPSVAPRQQLIFPEYLAPPRGNVEVRLVGDAWENQQQLDALLQAVPWKDVPVDLWPDQETRQQIVWNQQTVSKDARILKFDQPNAAYILGESGYYRTEFPTVFIGVWDNDPNGVAYANSLATYLTNAGFYVEITYTGENGLKELQELAKSRPKSGMIWVNLSGDAFRRQ